MSIEEREGKAWDAFQATVEAALKEYLRSCGPSRAGQVKVEAFVGDDDGRPSPGAYIKQASDGGDCVYVGGQDEIKKVVEALTQVLLEAERASEADVAP